MQHLEISDLKKMLLLSWERIEAQKEEINRINVFPVPDQDTGTNIAKTLEGIKDAIAGKKFHNTSEFIPTVMDALMGSAQGNSGIIYAGFLIGALQTIDAQDKVGPKLLHAAFKAGAEKARESIAEPKEGTMLDVVDAAAEALDADEYDIVSLLKRAVKASKQALVETQNKMPLLKKAGVVDAGGMAFLIILESYYDALTGDDVCDTVIKDSASTEVKRFIHTLQEKYEVVVLLDNVKAESEKIREALKDLGSSIDIVRTNGKVKIHIHTDHPKDTKKVISSFGSIINIIEEDLIKESTGQEGFVKQDIGIVTDSLSDITKKIAERYNIEIVELKWDWVLNSKAKGDNVYDKMRNVADIINPENSPKTSQPSPKDFIEAYKRQLSKYKEILCITFSQKMSGTYNSALQAINFLPEGDRDKVTVYDSKEGSSSEALTVLRAIELVNSQFNLEEVLESLKKTKVKAIGAVEDGKWLEYGGRINKTKSNLLKILKTLKFTPFLTVKNGTIQLDGFAFDQQSVSEAIYCKTKSEIRQAVKEGKKVRAVITHADNEEQATKLKSKLKEEGVEVSFANYICTAIGAHLGPGALVLGYMILD